MSINSEPNLDPCQSVTLKPFFRLPLLITMLGITLIILPINYWISIGVSIFGLFLLIQSFILRLEFTPNDLIVWQLKRELRRFPFKDWLAWRLFLPRVPGILYFREEASPHLLPILFDPESLEAQLKLRVGSLEVPKKELPKS